MLWLLKTSSADSKAGLTSGSTRVVTLRLGEDRALLARATRWDRTPRWPKRYGDAPLLAAQVLDGMNCYAAQRSYWWCKPPRCGIVTIVPVAGATGREMGESFLSDR